MSGDGRAPVRSLDVRGRLLDGRVVIGKGRDAFQLSEVGGMIWRLADGSQTVDAIAEQIAARFVDTPPAQIHADVHEFVDALVDDGYLQWVSRTSKLQIVTRDGR
jgi:Coenzyme PQQ synthesis protein D (PqqD)